MMKFELLRDKSILIIAPEGPLQKANFERLTREVDPFLESNGKLVGLMIHTKSFPGWESLGALVSHLRFVADHHRRIERIAVVTDSALAKVAPRIADHFVQAKIKHFDFKDRDRALAWLESGQ